MSELVKNIRLCAEDPMWDAHAEVPKKLLAKAADRIEALEAALRKIAVHTLSGEVDFAGDYEADALIKIARAALDPALPSSKDTRE